MPLLKLEKINADSHWALWQIDESVDELVSQQIEKGKSDFEECAIRHENKQKEWLAGRLALKALVEELGYEYHGIFKDEYGKPFLINHPNLHISLSNSFPFAAAIISTKKQVGIDLETVKEKLKALAPKFLNQEEYDMAIGDVRKLCICWSAKETLYKIYGRKRLAFKENLRVAPFTIADSGTIEGQIVLNGHNEIYPIKYSIDDYFIVTYNIDE
ncbi:MAG: 4'-phosphopantetheinyl transferase superfamily protein [Bacteroidota bacterium]